MDGARRDFLRSVVKGAYYEPNGAAERMGRDGLVVEVDKVGPRVNRLPPTRLAWRTKACRFPTPAVDVGPRLAATRTHAASDNGRHRSRQVLRNHPHLFAFVMMNQSVDSPATGNPSPDAERERASVVSAIARLERGERNALEEVREALCAFIAVLRSGGTTYEQAVDVVRRLVATPVTPEGAFNLFPAAREALVELSIYWCASEYAREA